MTRLPPVLASLLAFAILGLVALPGVEAEPGRPPSPSPSPSPTGTPTPTPPGVSPSNHDFGTTCVGGTSDEFQFVLTNNADDELAVSGITADAPFLAGLPASSVVPAGGSTTFAVRYRPDGSGDDAGSVVVDTDHGQATASLTGKGLDRQLSVAPRSLSFGPVKSKTSSGARTIIVANTGSDPLSITNVSLSGTDADDFALSGGGSFTLAANTARQVSLIFTPSSDGGKSATMTVSSNACIDPVRQVSLTGTGARGAIDVRPSKVALTGIVGKESLPVSVAVFDSGDAPLTVKSIRITGPSAREFSLRGLPRFPVTVVAGDSFVFDVKFRAAAVEDPPPSATIEVASSDATKPVVRVPITTVFASPSPTPSPSASASAAAPPLLPGTRGGPRLRLGALRGYIAVLVVVLIVVGMFAILIALRNLKIRRVIKNWQG
jgi:hypothetical protein